MYRRILVKALNRFMRERSFLNVLNLFVHAVPYLPSILQGSLIDCFWEKIEVLLK